MSRFDCDDPELGNKASCDAVEHIIVPRARDIGGFEVKGKGDCITGEGDVVVNRFIDT